MAHELTTWEHFADTLLQRGLLKNGFSPLQLGLRIQLLEEPHELVPEILVVTQVLVDDRALGVEDERGWHPLGRELLCEGVILVPL